MNNLNFKDFLNYLVLLKQNLNWINFLDLFFVVLIIFFFLSFFKKIHVHRVVLSFLISFALVYFFSFWFRFYTVLSIMNFLLSFLLIIFIVLFQKELRRFLHFLDLKNFKTDFLKNKTKEKIINKDFFEKLTKTIFKLAKERTGALIVLKRRDDLIDYLEGGFELFGQFSEPLILSLFDTSSPGHDGAVIIDPLNKIIERFGAVLPLTDNRGDILKSLGTRHRAGLGLSEKTDAIVIIVSEEKGTVAFCENGNITFLKNQDELLEKFKKYFYEKKLKIKIKNFPVFVLNLLKNYLFIFLFSFVVGVIFWGVNNIAYFNFIYQTIEAPVVFNKIPEKAVIEKLTNSYIELTLLGTEKDFKLLNKDNLKVILDISNLNLDNKTQYVKFEIKPDFIKYPSSFKLIKYKPEKIEFKLTFEEK